MASIGDIIEVVFYDFGVNAEGVGRPLGQREGLVVFAEGAVPGDVAAVRLTSVKKGWAKGELVQIDVYAKERVRPPCRSFGVCGGCRFLHVGYGSELKYKLKKVNDALKRIGGVNLEIDDIIGMEEPCLYRNKAVYHVKEENGEFRIGYYGAGSNTIVTSGGCGMLGAADDKIIQALKRYLEEYGVKRVSEITLRLSAYTGGVLVNIKAGERTLPSVKELAGYIEESIRGTEVFGKPAILEGITLLADGREARTLWGNGFIQEKIGRFIFKVSASSFFQINPKMTGTLYEKVSEYAELSGDDTVLDAYAGTGTISIFISERAGEVIGIENDRCAVEDAAENARLNQASNTRFIAGDAGTVMEALAEEGTRPSAVILDPPRSGCGRGVADALAKLSPKRIVYVSCDPATLARDLKDLAQAGYTAERGVCVDMFGGSAHVETVVALRASRGTPHLDGAL